MTVLSDYVSRMVAAGMDPSEAMQIVAEVFAAGAANVPARSSNAVRQQRYRDKKRNETVTNRNAVTPDENVTNRNETVTNRNEVTPPLSIEDNKIEKKGRRATQIPDDWRPSADRWEAACRQHGETGAARELQKFTTHHRAKGTTFKVWDFAWDKWMIKAEDWAPKQLTPVSSILASEINWPNILGFYKKTGRWSAQAGPDPDSPACRAPPELLREFGLLKSA